MAAGVEKFRAMVVLASKGEVTSVVRGVVLETFCPPAGGRGCARDYASGDGRSGSEKSKERLGSKHCACSFKCNERVFSQVNVDSNRSADEESIKRWEVQVRDYLNER